MIDTVKNVSKGDSNYIAEVTQYALKWSFSSVVLYCQFSSDMWQLPYLGRKHSHNWMSVLRTRDVKRQEKRYIYHENVWFLLH